MIKNYAVIMAGGSGRRLWPLSRVSKPKQFIDLNGEGALIVNTINRLKWIYPAEHIMVVGLAGQSEALFAFTKGLIPPENVLLEPAGRNTTACIAYALEHIKSKFNGSGGEQDVVVGVFPADHFIADEQTFVRILEKSLTVAGQRNSIVTLGVCPSYPATGYGYICAGDEAADMDGVREVERFVEKPDVKKAEAFVETGRYFWNCGIFVFRMSVMEQSLEEFQPHLYQQVKTAYRAKEENQPEQMQEAYRAVQSIAVDVGIMEKCRELLVIPGDFGWSDVGGYNAVYDVTDKDADGNAVLKGNLLARDAKNLLISSDKKLVAVSGVDDLVVIDTPDVLYICSAKDSDQTKEISERLGQKGYGEVE